VIAAGLAVVALLAVVGILAVWPTAAAAQRAAQAAVGSAAAAGFHPPRLPVLHIRLTVDVSQLLLAVLAGVLGACVHAMTVLAARVGNRTAEPAWGLWYLFAPLIGGALALFLYAVIRGGLLSVGGASSGVVSLYGVVAIAGLAGLFSRKVMERIASILGTPQAASSPGSDLNARVRGATQGTAGQ
jgi:hypothetical protein